jgi:hypothetical protein
MQLHQHLIFTFAFLGIAFILKADIENDIDPPKKDSLKTIYTDTVGVDVHTDINKKATEDTLVFEDWEHPSELKDQDVINQNTKTIADSLDNLGLEAVLTTHQEERTPTTELAVNKPLELVAYPNPVQNVLYVKGPASILSIHILNLKGEIQKSVANSTQINMSELPRGLYLVSIESTDGIAVKKIIKN